MAHNVKIKDTMRSTSDIYDIVKLLCSYINVNWFDITNQFNFYKVNNSIHNILIINNNNN